MNTITTILNLMINKKIDIIKNNELLIHFFENSSQSEQARINQVIICICGYSLDTIIYEPHLIKEI